MLVPPGFGQDVREWQTKRQLFPSHQAPSGLDISRPPSSLDGPVSPGEAAARLPVKDVDRHRTDDIGEGDNGEHVGKQEDEPIEGQLHECIQALAGRGQEMLVACIMACTK